MRCEIRKTIKIEELLIDQFGNEFVLSTKIRMIIYPNPSKNAPTSASGGINYKDYEIDKKKEKQKVKPKGKDDGKEITVKDYEEGGFFSSHKCSLSIVAISAVVEKNRPVLRKVLRKTTTYEEIVFRQNFGEDGLEREESEITGTKTIVEIITLDGNYKELQTELVKARTEAQTWEKAFKLMVHHGVPVNDEVLKKVRSKKTIAENFEYGEKQAEIFLKSHNIKEIEAQMELDQAEDRVIDGYNRLSDEDKFLFKNQLKETPRFAELLKKIEAREQS
ncbi:10329_t:CDS:2 [Funneliformis geosporum]|nr:10329_t:CDS:2 [Funneliformis geosporum]